MKKEWFSSSELITVDGLPSTVQGINQKARREQWLTRKRTGVQGKAVEYHIDSLPSKAKNYLQVLENSVRYESSIKSDPFHIWIEAYNQLTQNEKELVASWLIRNGISDLLNFIKMQLEGIE